MNGTPSKLREWIVKFRMKHGEDPKVIHVTANECDEVANDAICYVPIRDNPHTRLFGIEADVKLWAESVRERQLKVGMCRMEESLFVPKDDWSFRTIPDMLRDRLAMQMEVKLLQDVTELTVTLECDAWATWKRALRLVKWFPIRTRQVKIQGQVLYPYLKVQLPFNRHTVKFTATSVS